MTPKDYLTQIRTMNRRIRVREEQLKELRIVRASIGSVNYSREKVKGGAYYNAVEDRAIKLAELEERITQLKCEYVLTKARIIDQIKQMHDEKYSALLCYRYVDGLKLKDIAVKMHYDYKWLCHLHGKALDAFAEQYSDIVDKQPQEEQSAIEDTE